MFLSIKSTINLPQANIKYFFYLTFEIEVDRIINKMKKYFFSPKSTSISKKKNIKTHNFKYLILSIDSD